MCSCERKEKNKSKKENQKKTKKKNKETEFKMTENVSVKDDEGPEGQKKKTKENQKNKKRVTKPKCGTRRQLAGWLWLGLLASLPVVSSSSSSLRNSETWADFSDHASRAYCGRGSHNANYLAPVIQDTRCGLDSNGRQRTVFVNMEHAAKPRLQATVEPPRRSISLRTVGWILAFMGDGLWVIMWWWSRVTLWIQSTRFGFGRSSKFKRVKATRLQVMEKWKGPWRQAFRQIWFLDGHCEPARWAGQSRVPGVRGLRGLGQSWRKAPVKSCAPQDALIVRRCRWYLLQRMMCKHARDDFGSGHEHAYIITTPLRPLFRGGPYQNVSYIFWDPPLNVKLVAERPPGVVFVGRVLKVPSKCKLTFSRPPPK